MMKILVYQALYDFFCDFSVWQDSKLMKILAADDSPADRALKLEYDYLLKGTHADIYIPLWVSACENQGRILQNHTTLKIIKYYHKYGYQPILVDGNPPDYIGELLRFIVYLESALLSKPKNSDDLLKARDFFLETYLYPTLQHINKELEENSRLLKTTIIKIRAITSQLIKHQLDFSDQNEKELLAACQFSTVRKNGLFPPIKTPAAKVVNTAGINNCGGMCVIRPTVQEDCILRIETDVESNRPALKACVRGRGYQKTFLSGDRIRYPMKRVGERGAGTFERISWEEAVTIIAAEWKRIKAAYGISSRYVMYATGVTGIMEPSTLAKRLLSLDGGYLDYYNSYSSACARYVTPFIYGTADSGNSISDLINTKLLILWGHNPVETHFGTERAYYINQLKEKGVKIVVIDPRYSDTAATYADEWIAIRPSTDSALADAMAYVIWSEGLQDQNFMDQYCIGFDEGHMPAGVPEGESYHSYLFGLKDGIIKTPEWAEEICGVPANSIRKIAREYGSIKPSCLLVGLGLQRTRNGELSIRSTALLTCLTGNVGIPGGNAGGTGGVIEHHRLALADPVKNPYHGKIPVFQWTKVIEKGAAFDQLHDGLTGVEQLNGGIKMILNLAGNTLVNQHSDINKTTGLLKDTKKCEFILASDIFMTASARYADLVLPGTSVFEGNNMVNPWTGGNYILYNNQVIKPLFECRFEWEWLKAVAGKLGYYEEFIAGRPELEDWLKASYEQARQNEAELPEYEVMKQRGGWQYQQPGYYIAFENEIKDPHNHPFSTPSGKIEIFPQTLFAMNHCEIPGIPKYIPCQEGPEDRLKKRYPLQLIGWHTKRRCHSIHDNNEWMDEVEAPAVWIHPDDARERQIADLDLVEIYNDRGCVRIPAKVTYRIMKGVTAISQGGWYRPDGQGTDTRGSINVLTESDHPSPLAKGNPQHTNLVQIRRYNCQL